ncbi:MAG: AtpZ/AtpI family protein [bacterium]
MVEYSRLHIKKVNSSFVIEPFHQKKKEIKMESIRLIDALDLGVYLIVPLLVGLGAGIFLDTKLGTKPLCIICGLLLGSLGSFFNLIKIVRQFSKHA